MATGPSFSSSSLFQTRHPLVPLAIFNIDTSTDQPAAIEESGSVDDVAALVPRSNLLVTGDPAESGSVFEPATFSDGPMYSLFPSAANDVAVGATTSIDETSCDGAPDFLGRLHHMKTLFRMSQTKDPISVMIHRCGPLLILDDGPRGWSRGDERLESRQSHPLPPFLSEDVCGGGLAGQSQRSIEADSQLMLAALEPMVETALVSNSPTVRPSGVASLKDAAAAVAMLPELPPCELKHTIRNTFIEVEDDAECSVDEPLVRAWSAPADVVTSQPPRVETPPPPSRSLWRDRGSGPSSSLSLIPYQQAESVPFGGASGGDKAASVRQHIQESSSLALDLLRCQSQQKLPQGYSSAALEAVKALYSGSIPPQLSRMGRSVEWRCGPFKILLGCDLVVLQSSEKCDYDYASFKMLPPGRECEPTREDRIDVYLENIMCDISKAVWGAHDKKRGKTSWRVFNTDELPDRNSSDSDGNFDAKLLQDQGQRLLHFLRHRCHTEGGTYWLYREENSPSAELFHLREPPAVDDGLRGQRGGSSPSSSASSGVNAFRPNSELAVPLATLCLRLAKGMPNSVDQRRLLQKGLHLLEPIREEHTAVYAMSALQLACSYMRIPLTAIPDAATPGQGFAAGSAASGEPPPAARLAVALRHLESSIRLLGDPIDDADREERDHMMVAELRLQAHVAYVECIQQLVNNAIIPTYRAWMSELQKASAQLERAELGEMKRLSVALLLWRLFWLCRALRSLSFVPAEKRVTECWTIDRDLCELIGDTLYGLSRYPADDVDELLEGEKMATAEGICSLVEVELRSWGLRGASTLGVMTVDEPNLKTHKKRGGRRSVSRHRDPSPIESSGDEVGQAHNITALFLSRLNPLARDLGDETLREDPLVRDNLRRSLWTKGRAFGQSLQFFERATSRLKRKPPGDNDSGNSFGAGQRRWTTEDQATLMIARKLAHLYNEEARSALMEKGNRGTEKAEQLFMEALRWMKLSGDTSNASRVLLNVSELYARRAEARRVEPVAEEFSEALESALLTEGQYDLWLQAAACCEEAAAITSGELGRRESAFVNLRAGVHLALHVPLQVYLHQSGDNAAPSPGAPSKEGRSILELADKHLSKALCGFDELHEEREVAVCHFHISDLVLQEQKVAGAPLPSKARLTSSLRHARRSAEYWERMGAVQYCKDYMASHIRISRLLELQHYHRGPAAAAIESMKHLADAECKFVALAAASCESSPPSEASTALQELVIRDSGGSGKVVAVVPFRREMSRVCQGALRHGEDTVRLKATYRHILRNEPLELG